ncbi:MAG: hypothetical protein ACI9LM_004417 [Alteromonadaceae bacterium]|jgi:hypothetical protein
MLSPITCIENKLQCVDQLFKGKPLNPLLLALSPALLLLFTTLLSFTNKAYAGTEIGVFVSDYSYEETMDGNFIMQDKATMLGVRAAVSTYKRDLTWKLDGSFQYGNMNYTSNGTGSLKGSDDFIFEVRGIVSDSIQLSSGVNVLPFVGIGYQYLIDDAQGMKTTTGHVGYLRMQSYLYSPIGIEINNILLTQTWTMGLKFEYDLFFHGANTTDLGSVGKPTFKFQQNKGNGLRSSIRFTTQQFAVEPFIKYWRVEKSNSVVFNDNGTLYKFYEPDNTTAEFGVSFIYIFN